MRRVVSKALCLAPMLALLASQTGVASFPVKEARPPVKKTFEYGKLQNTYARNSLIGLRGGEGLSEQTPLASTSASASVDSAETTPIARGSEAYYLVWSPKFFATFALATILLTTTRHFGWDHRVLDLFSGSLRFLPSGFLSNLVLPLLSSSCCAIQLAVNAISVAIMGAGAGCIGFNTFLGPLRPYLLAVVVAYHTFQSTPSATLFRYAIAFMPEFVFGWNEVLRSYWKKRNSSMTAGTTADGVSETTVQATLIVEVPTMGCVACVNKIESSLRSCAPDKIETASSWLNPKENGGKKGGRAKIEVKASSKGELDDLAKSLVGAIEDAGFQGSTIESLAYE